LVGIKLGDDLAACNQTAISTGAISSSPDVSTVPASVGVEIQSLALPIVLAMHVMQYPASFDA